MIVISVPSNFGVLVASDQLVAIGPAGRDADLGKLRIDHLASARGSAPRVRCSSASIVAPLRWQYAVPASCPTFGVEARLDAIADTDDPSEQAPAAHAGRIVKRCAPAEAPDSAAR